MTQNGRGYKVVLDNSIYFRNSGNMESKPALECLSALAHEHRLALFRLLVQAGGVGMVVGELAAATGLAGATLNHHLNQLRQCGLVEDERQGRVIRCRANYARMNGVLDYLTDNCCAGSSTADACASNSSRKC